MYERELAFVEEYLIKTDGIYPKNILQPFRNRYEHTLRVLSWSKVISKGKKINKDILYLSAIFHDVGYGVGKDDLENHAKYSSSIWLEYSKDLYDEKTINDVSYLILNHSKKELLRNKKSVPLELILLMEADILDEEGLMGFEWDALTCGAKRIKSYSELLPLHKKYIDKFLKQKPMVTSISKKIWRKKQKSAYKYYKQIQYDLSYEK